MLLTHNADVNVAMSAGSHHSPLTIAAFMRHTEVYSLLLQNGADTEYRALPWDTEPFVTDGGTAAEILQARARA